MTANDRLKASFSTRIWEGVILATLLHVAVLGLWPPLTAQDYGRTSGELEMLDVTPEVELPEAPPEIHRPAVPRIAEGVIDEAITISRTTFEDNPPATLPPPVDSAYGRGSLADTPVFTPMTVRPDIRNRDEVARALEREYPALLRDAGIGGTVNVWFFIDETGTVQRTLVNTSSGHRALDDAALAVAGVIRFTPALNRDKRVAVWISLPVTFQVR